MKNTTLLDVAKPAQEFWITIDGGRIRYLKQGSGPPLLMLHGLLGYSFSWRFAMPEISRHSTIYAPDALGTGFSDRPFGIDTTLRGSAQRLLRFLDEIGVGTVDLLGTSHGGGVVMMAAALAPRRVKRTILVAPVNPWSARGTGLAPFLTRWPVSALFLALAPYLTIAHTVLLRRLYGDTRRIAPGTIEGYEAPFEIPGNFRYALDVLNTWKADLAELESMLPRIAHIPTLLVWGSEDRAVSPASAKILQGHFHHCRLLIFDGVGHLPYEEAPEQFNRAVCEFLDQNPVGVHA